MITYTNTVTVTVAIFFLEVMSLVELNFPQTKHLLRAIGATVPSEAHEARFTMSRNVKCISSLDEDFVLLEQLL